MPSLSTPIRRIGLMQKFHHGYRVIVARRQMFFVFRNSIHIHNTQNRILHGAGYSPIRPSSHLFYSSLEAFPVQNHNGAFGTERPIIIACDECRGFLSAPRRQYVRMIFRRQRRVAQRTFLLVHQFVRPEHSSWNGYINLFHSSSLSGKLFHTRSLQYTELSFLFISSSTLSLRETSG
jgi:hypothetical protein